MCVDCFNYTRGYARCYACSSLPSYARHLAVMVPISYSVAHEELHRTLAGYKRATGPAAERATHTLAQILSEHLIRHEACLAASAGVSRFEMVTTVPSSVAERDQHHPLRRIVGELVEPTTARHVRLLRRTSAAVEPRRFDPWRYAAMRRLDGESILLIDDTWTTGASARSAAAALQRAGAGVVGAVVIGRHLNRDWHRNDAQLRDLPRFDWSECARCGRPFGLADAA